MSGRGAEPELRLRVDVAARPDPLLLPAAISARLAGRPFPAGPEAAVAGAVARAVERRKEERCR